MGDLKHHNAFNSGGTSSVNSQTFSDRSLQKYDEDDDGSDSDWDGFPVKFQFFYYLILEILNLEN